MKLFKISLIILVILVTLSLPVTTKQGVNYNVKIIKIPLYIKVIEFFDRHYHYKELVKRITRGCNSEEERALALFKWTHQNIKANIPKDWPLIDDHVWHIIVRGYGAGDQFSDVFSTLCNYAGIDAFFQGVYALNQTKKIPLAFVKINEKWCVFDPYYGNCFINKNGQIADIEDIKSGGSWTVKGLNGKSDIDYSPYISNLPSIRGRRMTRANIQSPANRFLFEIKKIGKYFSSTNRGY